MTRPNGEDVDAGGGAAVGGGVPGLDAQWPCMASPRRLWSSARTPFSPHNPGEGIYHNSVAVALLLSST